MWNDKSRIMSNLVYEQWRQCAELVEELMASSDSTSGRPSRWIVMFWEWTTQELMEDRHSACSLYSLLEDDTSLLRPIYGALNSLEGCIRGMLRLHRLASSRMPPYPTQRAKVYTRPLCHYPGEITVVPQASFWPKLPLYRRKPSCRRA